MRYITAALHGKTFYLPQDLVLEIDHKATVTRVPFAPGWVVGIMPYREEPVAVLDAFVSHAPAAKLQILCKPEDCVVAYQADFIGDIREPDEAEIEPLAADDNRFFAPIRVPKTEMQG